MYFDERRALLEAAAQAFSAARAEGSYTKSKTPRGGAVPDGATLFFCWKRGCLSADWGLSVRDGGEEMGELRATFHEGAAVN